MCIKVLERSADVETILYMAKDHNNMDPGYLGLLRALEDRVRKPIGGLGV